MNVFDSDADLAYAISNTDWKQLIKPRQTLDESGCQSYLDTLNYDLPRPFTAPDGKSGHLVVSSWSYSDTTQECRVNFASTLKDYCMYDGYNCTRKPENCSRRFYP